MVKIKQKGKAIMLFEDECHFFNSVNRGLKKAIGKFIASFLPYMHQIKTRQRTVGEKQKIMFENTILKTKGSLRSYDVSKFLSRNLISTSIN